MWSLQERVRAHLHKNRKANRDARMKPNVSIFLERETTDRFPDLKKETFRLCFSLGKIQVYLPPRDASRTKRFWKIVFEGEPQIHLANAKDRGRRGGDTSQGKIQRDKTAQTRKRRPGQHRHQLSLECSIRSDCRKNSHWWLISERKNS